MKKTEEELTKLIDYLKVNSELRNYEENFAEDYLILIPLRQILKKFFSQELISKFSNIASNCGMFKTKEYLGNLDNSTKKTLNEEKNEYNSNKFFIETQNLERL